MASNRIMQITQTPCGEIWIATQDGVSRFDGMTWYTFPDSLPIPPSVGHFRMEVLEDSSVVLASLSQKEVIMSLYKGGRWQSLDFLSNSNVPDRESFVMASSVEPTLPLLSIALKDTIYSYTEMGWSPRSVPLTPEEHIRSILTITSDSLLVVTNNSLFLVTEKNIERILTSNNLLATWYESKSQTCYLLFDDALAYCNLTDSTLTYLYDKRLVGSFYASHTSKLFKNGDYLYYSLNSTLTQFNPRTQAHREVVTDYFTTEYTCTDALIDHEGSIWVATLRGAFRLKNPSIHNFNDNNLIDKEVSAVLEGSDGNLYIGSNLGLTILDSNSRCIKYPFTNRMKYTRIMDIIEHDSGIYFSTIAQGVKQFVDHQIISLGIPNSLIGASDLASYDGKLYCTTLKQLFQLENKEWSLAYELTKGTIRKAFLNEKCQLLLTDNGVHNIETDEHYLGDAPYVNSVYTGIIYQDEILLGTAGGICQLVNNKIVRGSHTLDAPVYSLAVDSLGELWAGTDHGVWHLSTSGDFNYHKGNGLVGNEVNRNAFLFSNSHQLVVGTDEGMSLIDPSQPKKSPVPNIQITSIEANQRPISNFDLSHQSNNIRFHFRSTSYYNIDELNYRYRLLGLDNSWEYIDFAEQNSAYYHHLKPGHYQFQVQSRIGNGNWSSLAKGPKITIHEAFYEAIWFRIVSIFLITGGFVSFYKYRSQTLNSQKQELKKRVRHKTEELAHRNQELIKTIKDLKAAQGRLIQSEKLASMGHLTSGIAHELNNPLNYIRGGAECIMRNMDELSEIFNANEACKVNVKTIMDDCRLLAESIHSGAIKSTDIVKSLGSFTADSQNFFSFTDLQKEIETSLILLNNEIGFRIIVNKMFANIPQIECYPAKINQMMVNILLNSVQAIKGSGEITIRFYRKDDEHIAIEVSDDGQGMPTYLHDQVFEPFFTTKDSNPGLGLTIAKSIVMEHKGTITFISKAGIGTNVKICLPVNQTYHPELL